MTRCSGCGEALPNAGEACPVCNTLGLPEATIFDSGAASVADDKNAAAKGSLLNTGPVLGVTRPVLPSSQLGKGPDDIVQPVQPAQPSEDTKRFEEEAEIYGSDAFNIKRIAELRQRNVPIVLFLGMRTTGKTWLIQRMKEMLKKQFDCYPAVKLTQRATESDAIVSADEAEQRQKYLGRTELTKAEQSALLERQAAGDSGRTSAMIFHEFEPIKEGEGHEFALVDVPGEDFRKLAEGQFFGIRSLACALKYAGTVIVALPSDITLLGPRVSASEFDDAGDVDAVRADHEFVQMLTGSLADMSKMRSILIGKDIDVTWKPAGGDADAYDREITREKLRAHTWKNGRQPFGGEDGMGCPVYVALTKADKFFAASEKLPDVHGASATLIQKLEAANQRLREASDGPLYSKLFQSSSLNLENLLEKPSWFSDVLKVLVGKRSHVAPISNPPEMMLQADGALFTRLNANFPMSRIDLVAAFYGHTGNTLCVADLENHPQIGVKQMTDWLAKVHDDGVGIYHGWARSAFERIYETDEQMAGPTGGVRRKIHNWRLRHMPSQILAGMFRKEFHPLQIAPALFSVIGMIALSLLTINWLEPKAKFAQTAIYNDFKNAVLTVSGPAQGQKGSAAVPAFAALPVLPDTAQRLVREGKVTEPYAKALWDPVADLASWSEKGNSLVVPLPKPVPAQIDAPQNPPPGTKEKNAVKAIREAQGAIADLRFQQLAWQERYVCDLEGWGDYRGVIRKAAMNGYGQCSAISKFAMRSPLIDSMQNSLGWWGGALVGLLLWAAFAALVVASILYALWYSKTRAAYGWLYHSGVATTQRSGKTDTA